MMDMSKESKREEDTNIFEATNQCIFPTLPTFGVPQGHPFPIIAHFTHSVYQFFNGNAKDLMVGSKSLLEPKK